jgi:hypothetical protein
MVAAESNQSTRVLPNQHTLFASTVAMHDKKLSAQ